MAFIRREEALIMPPIPMGAVLPGEGAFIRLRRQELTPVPSAALTMAAMSGALPSAEGQASGEVFMAVREVFMPAGEVFMAVGEATGNRAFHISQRDWHMPERRKEPCCG